MYDTTYTTINRCGYQNIANKKKKSIAQRTMLFLLTQTNPNNPLLYHYLLEYITIKVFRMFGSHTKNV